jgi:hypothetical protein
MEDQIPWRAPACRDHDQQYFPFNVVKPATIEQFQISFQHQDLSYAWRLSLSAG